MSPDEAVKIVQKKFPFKIYMDIVYDGCLHIGKTVSHYLPQGSKVLDFGCGPCDKTAVLSTLGYNCSAYDDLDEHWHRVDGNRDKIINFIKEFNIDFKLAKDRTLPFQKESFDMVMMHDVLEHFDSSPRDMLNDLLELVKPEGYFFATVPNAVNIKKRLNVLAGRTNYTDYGGYYWYPNPWRGHAREYVKNDLIKLAEYLNLEIIELHTWHNMLIKLPHILHPIFRGLTSIFPGWRDSWMIIARKKQNWKPAKTLPWSEHVKHLRETTYYPY